MMVFDEWRNGVPVAYIITSRARQIDLAPWMLAIRSRMRAGRLDWQPSAFVVDDADAEINSLQ